MDRDARIEQLRAACGCKEGAAALLLVVAAYIFAPEYFPRGDTIWAQVAIGLGIALAGAVVGKIAGLLIAHVKLRRLLRSPMPSPDFSARPGRLLQ